MPEKVMVRTLDNTITLFLRGLTDNPRMEMSTQFLLFLYFSRQLFLYESIHRYRFKQSLNLGSLAAMIRVPVKVRHVVTLVDGPLECLFYLDNDEKLIKGSHIHFTNYTLNILSSNIFGLSSFWLREEFWLFLSTGCFLLSENLTYQFLVSVLITTLVQFRLLDLGYCHRLRLLQLSCQPLADVVQLRFSWCILNITEPFKSGNQYLTSDSFVVLSYCAFLHAQP